MKNLTDFQKTVETCVNPHLSLVAALSPFMSFNTVPTQPMLWMMCESWPHHRGLRPLLFSNGVGSFTSHKNQISQSAVRPDLQFFVLICEKTRKSNHAFVDVITKATLPPQ